MKSPNLVAILVTITEIAKRLHENISKIQLEARKGFLATAAWHAQSESAKHAVTTMFTSTRVWVVVTLIVLLGDCTGFAFGAAAGGGSVNQRGAKAAEQMSTKGGSNSNAQWSADPVRGWVRADVRHKIHEKTASWDATKQNDGSRSRKAKAKSFNLKVEDTMCRSKKIIKSTAVSIVASMLLLAGCAGGPLSTREKGAGIGVLGGAATGGIIGAAVGHPGAGAAIGGALGLGAGAIGWRSVAGSREHQLPATAADQSQPGGN